MPTQWMSAYVAALGEQDPAKVPELYEQARRAIHCRLLELENAPADVRERGELDEALRQITIRSYK